LFRKLGLDPGLVVQHALSLNNRFSRPAKPGSPAGPGPDLIFTLFCLAFSALFALGLRKVNDARFCWTWKVDISLGAIIHIGHDGYAMGSLVEAGGDGLATQQG